MNKTVQRVTNFYIRVDPWVPSYMEHDPNKIHGWVADVVAQIRRHVDGIEDVEVVIETASLCAHCGFTPEPDETGEPRCCTAAIEEWEANDTGAP